MNAEPVALDRTIWLRLGRAIRTFVTSAVGAKARLYFAALLLLLFAINGLNVVNSYVGRDFMTAIEQRSSAEFVSQAVRYAAVFLASTVAAVIYRFCEERLGLLWREWLTRQLLHDYLARGHYYRLKDRGEIDNPDQRIAEDVRTFTTTTLSLALMLLNGTFTIVAFSGVLWSISPLLFGVAVGYASIGSLLTLVLGRPLLGLSYVQFDREAAFRADLVHVRENAESVAFLQREGRMGARILDRLDALVTNARRIIAVNRNLGFFTTGYNYGIQLIPALIVGPLFIRGLVEFGVITQAAMAFSHLLGAFSLIVTQFQSISSYAVVLTRVSTLCEATERAASSTIETIEDDERLAYERLTLRSRLDDRILLAAFTVSVPLRARVLVSGPNEGAKVALFRATAGLWDAGEGRIVRPSPDLLMLLPERPYLPPGTLREVLVRTGRQEAVPDEKVVAILRALDLEPVLARTGGLDVERDWDDLLALGEHQLLSVARVLLSAPRFVVVHRLGTTLGPEMVARVLDLFSEAGIAVLELGEAELPLEAYDGAIEVSADGTWRWKQPPRAKVGGA
jgi:putative ATP-binding cassette transporter